MTALWVCVAVLVTVAAVVVRRIAARARRQAPTGLPGSVPAPHPLMRRFTDRGGM